MLYLQYLVQKTFLCSDAHITFLGTLINLFNYNGKIIKEKCTQVCTGEKHSGYVILFIHIQ